MDGLMEIVKFFDVHSGAMSFLVTAILVVVTWRYVALTGKTLNELRQQRLDMVRPKVIGRWCSHWDDSTHPIVQWNAYIVNPGFGPATELSLRTDCASEEGEAGSTIWHQSSLLSGNSTKASFVPTRRQDRTMPPRVEAIITCRDIHGVIYESVVQLKSMPKEEVKVWFELLPTRKAK